MAEQSSRSEQFVRAKTLFQTNVAYDARIGLAVDGVIVHQHHHGLKPEPLQRSIASWHAQGYPVGRMFFADSDAANEYWTGKWDGTPRPDDMERDAGGEPVLCAGVRPYMLPTEGWIRYLREMTVQSLAAGADAILPEEPLAIGRTGYEQSFRGLWRERYGRDWQPQTASPAARFLTGQLKSELHHKLVSELAEETSGSVPYILPVHSLYSNVASDLVAPLGSSLSIPGIDGYIGQVWTGPVNWTLANYGSPDKSFFSCAYLLYDYFVELAVGTGRRLWLLIDPVEDHPHHSWESFAGWYKQSVVAAMMFPGVDAFEVMPWPDRIFLPGHAMGGGTPAPEDFRLLVLSATQALQEVPAGAKWLSGQQEAARVGVAVADTLMWKKEPFPPLQGMFGMLVPLVEAGVPVASCIMERSGDSQYMSRFKVIILAYAGWKPLSPNIHAALVEWVQNGGSLVVLSEPRPVEGQADWSSEGTFWWHKAGFDAPLDHLLAEFGPECAIPGDHVIGRGRVFRRVIEPDTLGDPDLARRVYLPLVQEALAVTGAGNLRMPGHFLLRRGPYLVAHATQSDLVVPGPLLDIFDADLPVLEGARLQPGEGGLYKDLSRAFAAAQPGVLHATHRLMAEEVEANTLRAVVRGPAGTPAVLRIFAAGRDISETSARDSTGQPLDLDVQRDQRTVRVKFANQPAGATVEITWK